ncbi:mannonate dehydratase [Castellaniella defragrans]|uniref:Mannonate dehydratase n=1 Tax=Castellaniella defragrans TaxID=75697 RepID=A0A7W9TP83_CASDE|nr:mannonate dehydratase [Castellaniella defragrans]KAB0622431.1 mannonate dehydratase [Castellaniella defragrans]MBB6083458.1 mannonate dehydratase [Castellaniella defragrans]
MEQTWRWFGPKDPIPLNHVRQAGATGIVTALHHVPAGQAWPVEEIARRQQAIEAAGMCWSVVESIPVPESIKLRTGSVESDIQAWKTSLARCGQAGIRTVCYNFMPVVDWTRTDLMWPLPSTGYALRFDIHDFAVYDIFILQRENARDDFDGRIVQEAERRFARLDEAGIERLEKTIIAGLPGADFSYDRAALRRLIAQYDQVGPDDLARNLALFLEEVAPVAQAHGVQLGIHPDDPPMPLFGLPRIVSTKDDLRRLLDAVPIAANGLTLCVGSLGVRAGNDLVDMVRTFADRIHFAHLRDVTYEPNGSFFEAEHLDGSSDMIGVVSALLAEERRRREQGHAQPEIPFRPDHGHLLGDDIGKRTNPGYSYIGRLKGLAELRGVIRTLEYAQARGAEKVR